MENIMFPLYGRAKVTWTIDNFTPELLRNGRFYHYSSPEFTIKLSSLGNTTTWQLALTKMQSSVSCHLVRIDKVYSAGIKPFSVQYDVGILNHRFGTVSNHTKGKLDNCLDSGRLGRLINFRELQTHSRELLKDQKIFVIVVRLDVVEDIKIPDLQNAMSSQYEQLFNNRRFSDFTLLTDDKTEIPVHKNIMATRSTVFGTMMETKMRESEENLATIDDIDGKALMEFLRFVYSGRVEKLDDVACELLYASTKYNVPDLAPLCVSSLCRRLSHANILETVLLAELHNENELKLFCIDYIKWNYEDLKESEGWKDVPQALYKEILDEILPINAKGMIQLDSVINLQNYRIQLGSVNPTLQNPIIPNVL